MNPTTRLRLRWPLPATVVTAAMLPSLVAEVRVALGGAVVLHGAECVGDCRHVLERHTGVCVLCTVPGADDEARGRQLLELRAQFPHVSVVALFVETASDARWALRLGQAGVTELVPCGHTVRSSDLLIALSRCETDSVAVRIWKAAGLHLDDALVNVLKPAVRLAHAPISMTRLAGATRMHERTLRKYCEHHRLASPQWIIGWARLLVAAYYLEEPGRTIQSVADLLEFPSAVSLANYVRRYTAHTPSVLRQAGALHAVARLLERRLGYGHDDCHGDRADVSVAPLLRLHRA